MSQLKKGSYVLMKHTGIEQPYHWVLKDPDGKIILISENYKEKHSALSGIASVRHNCKDDHQYNRLTASDGRFYCTLEADNGKIIGKGQLFDLESQRDKDIQKIKDYGTEAILTDMTEGTITGTTGAVTTDLAEKSTSAKRYA